MNRTKNKKLTTELKHLVMIQSKQKTSDGEGGFTEVWKNKKQVFAAVYAIRAVQQYKMKSVGVDATHHIKVRGYTVVDEADQILFNERVFEILTIENIQEDDFLKFITCKERR